MPNETGPNITELIMEYKAVKNSNKPGRPPSGCVWVKDEEGNEVLIPYIWGQYVNTIDLEQQKMIVDWQLEAG